MIEIDKKTRAKAVETTALDRNTYRALKRDLIGIEEENLGEIILQKCSGEGDWFEIADHSALIYYYLVCQPLKVKNIRFEADYDSFFEQYKIGRIRTRGSDGVRKRLKTVGQYGGEHVVHGRVVFVLKKSLPKDKMRIFEKRESERRLTLNKTVEIAHADPLFYRNLSAMMQHLHQTCGSKLDKLTSQTNGARIITVIDKMMATYLHMTDLPADHLEARKADWTEIRKSVYDLKHEIQIIDIIQKWSPEICVRLFEQNEELLSLANKNLIKVIQEIKEKEKDGRSEIARGV